MCLAKVTKRYDPPEPDEIKAWKVFRKDAKGNLRFHSRHSIVKRGVWLRANKRPKYIRPDNYPNGFHVFTTRHTALSYAGFGDLVMAVRVRQIHTAGNQGYWHNWPTLVAYELFVPEED